MVEDSMLNAKKELVDSAPKAVVYAVTAFVIWLFTKAVFIPMGDITLYGNITASTVIVAISTVTILIIVLKVLKEIRDVCDAVSALIASTIDPKAAPTEYVIYQNVLKSIVYVLFVAIAFLFFGSLLNEIHSALSGIILVIVFLWAVGTLYRAGMMVSDKVEAKAKKITARVLHLEEK